MVKTHRAVLLLALVALVAVACGSSGKKAASTTTTLSTLPAPTTTTTTVPPGFTAFHDAADKFHVATPSGWLQVDPASPAASQQLQALLKLNPQLKSAYPDGVASLASAGVKFIAQGPVSTATGYRAQLNIVVRSVPGISGGDLEALAPEFAKEFAQFGATVLSNVPITLGGQPAIQILLQLKVNLSGGRSAEVPEMLDVMIANFNEYVLVFAGDNPDFTAIQETFALDS